MDHITHVFQFFQSLIGSIERLSSLVDTRFMNTLDWLERTTWQASLLIALVLIVKRLLGNRVNPTIHYFLWVPVLVRLTTPWFFNGSMSIYSIIDYVPGASSVFRFYVGQSGQGGSFLYILVLVWLAGVAFLSIRFAMRTMRFGSVLSQASQVSDISVLQLLEECKECMSVRKKVKLVETPLLSTPAITGIFRPTLILPEGLANQIASKDLRYVFLHELAHYKSGDLWVYWLAKFIGIVHWFNPLAHIAISSLFKDCEKACDSKVLDCLESRRERRDYGVALLKLSSELPESNRAAAPAALFVFSRKELIKQRIDVITRFRSSWGNKRGLAMLSVLPLALGAVSQPSSYCIYDSYCSEQRAYCDAVTAPDLIEGQCETLAPKYLEKRKNS